MQDIKNNHFNGNITINDNSVSNEYKLLYECNNEELISEEQYRKSILKNERKENIRFSVRY